MTKKTTQKKSPGSKKGLSIGSVIALLLLVGLFFINEQLGLVDLGQEAAPGGENVANVTATPPAAPAKATPVSGEWYRLYFTSPQYPDKPETRLNTIVDGFVEAINSAQHSLDIAIYQLNLPQVGQAILAARERGVQVRLVTDTDSLEELDVLIELKQAGLPIVPDDRGAIMHNKFAVVDGQAVWAGSWNFTPNDAYRNNNNAIFIHSPELAANYTAEFEEMFNDHAFGPKSPANTSHPTLVIGNTQIETCYAPEDGCSEKLVNALAQAQTSIHFMAFSFTHEGIGQAVHDRAKAGVSVQGVFETRGSETEYSEYGRMKKQGLEVWQDGNPYTLHHKVFIIDDQTVVMGSYNFSASADEANDENMLIIHNAEIAARYNQEFEHVSQQAQNPPNH
jgi:phosphatidylserine/phosphatidylglycerophosphate/cardiolipin synthase-like enzyme